MVRTIQGGKIRNIRNLIIDTLEDVTPLAVCIHVCTNDISNGKNIQMIIEDMQNLIELIKRQGIVPIITLVTQNDKHASRVNAVNSSLIKMISANNEIIQKQIL